MLMHKIFAVECKLKAATHIHSGVSVFLLNAFYV